MGKIAKGFGVLEFRVSGLNLEEDTLEGDSKVNERVEVPVVDEQRHDAQFLVFVAFDTWWCV